MEGATTFRFRCGTCSKEYAVDPSTLPASGARGPCRQCGAALVLYPDGRAEGIVRADAMDPLPRAAPVPAPPDPPPAAAAPQPQPVPPPPAPAAPPGLRCPACGKPFLADLSRVPTSGARGRCAACQVPLVLFPDGTVRREGAAEGPSLWELEQGGQALGPFTLEDLKELARSGGLSESRVIRPQGGAWAAAAAFPEVAALFSDQRDAGRDAGSQGPPAEAPPGLGDARNCYAHPKVRPAYACSQCMRYLCEACAYDSAAKAGTRTLKVCAACGGLVTELTHREEWTPFYRDLLQVFTSPLRGHALFYFAILIVAELCKVPARFGGPYGLMAIGILVTFQMSFYLHVIREVGHGSYQFPEWPDMTDVGAMVGSVFKVLVVTIVALIPAFLVSMLLGAGSFLSILAMLGGGESAGAGAAGGLLLTLIVAGAFALVYAFYLPMAVTIVAVFNTVAPALNPILIARIIGRIGLPYVAAVALLVALEVIGAVLAAFLRGEPVTGAILAAVFNVYGSLVTCYILGRVVYENEERIGWSV